MTSLAYQHLTELRRNLHTPTTATLAQHAHAPAELSRLTSVLARYHDRIATGFGIPYTSDNGVRGAARRTATLLHQAVDTLGTPSDIDAPTSDLTEGLRAVSIALGCGLDLLASHVPSTQGRSHSASAEVIGATDTARSLLHHLSEYTATAAHLTQLTTAPAQQAAVPLLRAAVLARVIGQANDAPITAVPFHHTPERIPPRPGEGIDELLEGISATAQRLENFESPVSVPTWRYLATAAAITCDINHKLALSLTRRLKELQEHEPASAFEQATSAARRTSTKWRIVAKHWNKLPGHYGHPTEAPATDASDLIIRLGRLVYADPDWRPSPRATYRVKPLEEFAPTPAKAARTATAALLALNSCNAIASHHRSAGNDAAIIAAIQKSQQDPKYYPHQTIRAAHFAERYKIAQSAGDKAINLLKLAVRTLSLDAGELKMRIISQVDKDFPASIQDALATHQESQHAPRREARVTINDSNNHSSYRPSCP
ncbi:hypothetical protein [Actinomadura sp. WMMB 499]|uniref:hypothetical protein n=1 Tax=Actinomadura sp. WMMB 499 TaxID=1219491 RepID=UPI001244FAF5|nr:hypothetical protein [Actinomadura sp. WMMB 499]QFG22856.1 hypothetical protein F7P10_18775 [Actinomadura sp. WMMB 499]